MVILAAKRPVVTTRPITRMFYSGGLERSQFDEFKSFSRSRNDSYSLHVTRKQEEVDAL
jgi:hypothetical protein